MRCVLPVNANPALPFVVDVPVSVSNNQYDHIGAFGKGFPSEPV